MRSEYPLTTASRSWRFARDWSLLLLVLLGFSIALHWLWSLTPPPVRPGREQESENALRDENPAFGQVLHIWLPAPFVDMAKRESWAGEPNEHQEVRKLLNRPDYQGLCYAYCLRTYAGGAHPMKVAYIRHPYQEPWRYREFLDVLATAAGKPPHGDQTDYSTAETHIVNENMSMRELQEEIRASVLLP